MDQNKKCINLLIEQLKGAHDLVESTLEGTGDDQAHHVPDGTALPVGAAYGHSAFSEDNIIAMITKSTPLYASSWKDKTGFSAPMPGGEAKDWSKEHAEWAKSVKVDMTMAKEYAKAVYTATEKYLLTLTDANLADPVDLSAFGSGSMPLSAVLSGFIIGHAHNIAGEISAIKGTLGLKGYPF